MKMLTTKEISEAWNISERMVRRFCVDGRIPEAKLENGTWLIPSGTPKPKRKPKEKTEDPKENLTAFAKRVVYQCNKNNHYGIYEYTQVYLTYSSNRMASNRLTRNEVEEVYRTNKISTTFEPVKVDDIIDDKRRSAYNRGIAAWSEDHEPLISVSLEAQKRFQGKMELCALFQYARYPEPYQGGKL